MRQIKRVNKPKRTTKTRISFHTRDIIIALVTFIVLPVMITLRYALGVGAVSIILFTFLAKILFDYVSKTVEVVPEVNPIRFH